MSRIDPGTEQIHHAAHHPSTSTHRHSQSYHATSLPPPTHIPPPHMPLREQPWGPPAFASTSRSSITNIASPILAPEMIGPRPVPVPSEVQVNDYLISRQSQPLGLKAGWQIDGQILDVYALFCAVAHLGGSSEVSETTTHV